MKFVAFCLVGLLGQSLAAFPLVLSFRLPGLGVVEDEQPEPENRDKAAPKGQVDKTGTDPTNFRPAFTVYNEYLSLRPPDTWQSTLNLRGEYPLIPSISLMGTLPVVANNVGPEERVGLGDFEFRFKWRPVKTTRFAMVVLGIVKAPTATDDVLGTGNFTFAPSLTLAFFLSESLIFAPTYKHEIGVPVYEDRDRVHAGYIDVYFVWKPVPMLWVNIDPQFIIDYEHDGNFSGLLKIQMGGIIGKLGDGAMSAYVQPSAAFGAHRAYDAGAEIGFKLIF